MECRAVSLLEKDFSFIAFQSVQTPCLTFVSKRVSKQAQVSSMKFLVLLGILCVLCLDFGQVEGDLVNNCPKCKNPVECFANPCDVLPATEACPAGTECHSASIRRAYNTVIHFKGKNLGIVSNMKCLVLLGILCVLCLDIGQVKGFKLPIQNLRCPKECRVMVPCFVNPCEGLIVPCPQGTKCKPCYCEGCYRTCEKLE
ncbi:hypothetical protein ACROYT_G018673 [Oculina patagonica]